MSEVPLAPRDPRVHADLTAIDGAPDDETAVEDAELGPLELTGRRFELVDTTGSRFTGTRLAGSRWRRCTFHDCALSGCDLANAVFEQTGLRRVQLTGARLTGFAVGTAPHWDVTAADCQAELSLWRHARLERAAFRGCRLGRSDWGGATLTHVAFEDCDLSGADFSGCRMRSVLFRGCRYDGIRGIAGLRGAEVHVDDLLALGFAMAGGLGIRVQTGP
ncbi:MAG TPA: pentapeptide repeat-containing protein [Nocardioidaceae bacterium]|nr:pentapeptide repeat-containing protein [Nocardioidaceae bacterium]